MMRNGGKWNNRQAARNLKNRRKYMKRIKGTLTDNDWLKFFELVATNKSKGIGVANTLAQNGISLNHYSYHKARMKNAGTLKPTSNGGGFAKYVPASNGHVEIKIGNAVMNITTGDTDALTWVLNTVRGLA